MDTHWLEKRKREGKRETEGREMRKEKEEMEEGREKSGLILQPLLRSVLGGILNVFPYKSNDNNRRSEEPKIQEKYHSLQIQNIWMSARDMQKHDV